MKKIFRKIIYRAFEAGILLKAIFGFFEIFAGVLFSFSRDIIVNNFIIYLAQQEVADSSDGKDIIANYLIKTAQSLSQDSRIFAIAYLLFHGVVNIFLAIALAKGKAKTYPVIMAFLGIFIIYQVYKYFSVHSASILFLTIFDALFVLVIWLEYKRRR